MKKRMLSFLLALCLIVGMLPVIALAEDTAPTATVQYISASTNSDTTFEVAEGGATKYFTTGKYSTSKPDYSYLQETSDSENWNLKAEYPAGGKFTLTLKNADLYRPGVVNLRITHSADVDLVLEGENKIHSGNGEGIIFDVAGTSTISGTGKLTLISDLLCNYWYSETGVLASKQGDLVLDHADIYMRKADSAANRSTLFAVTGGDLIIKGGTVRADFPSLNSAHGRGANTYFRIVKKNEVGGNITVQDGAIVKIYASTYNGDNTDAVEIDGIFTIKNSDVELGNVGTTYGTLFKEATGGATNKGVYNYQDVMPTLEFENGYKVITSGSRGSLNFTTGKYTAPVNVHTSGKTDASTISITNSICYLRVSPIHEHTEGKVVYEGKDAICTTQKDRVGYCAICGDEISRETVTVPNENVHTPGEAELTVETKATKDTAGSYKSVTKCTVCGETVATESIPFEAGLFHLLTIGFEGYSASANPNIVLNPGETKYYITQQKNYTSGNVTYTNNWYRADGTADNWNIKLEYPIGGHPVMTLKGATIRNNIGIFYGNPTYSAKAPLKIVVEEDSVVYTMSGAAGDVVGPYGTIYGALNFYTSEAVTITGPGKLSVRAKQYKNLGIVHSNGDIIFDGADVEIVTNDDSTYSTNGIHTTCGDVIFKNTKMYIYGLDTKSGNSSANAFVSVIRAKAVEDKGGHIVIEDGSDITLIASAWYRADYGMSSAVQADKGTTIRDSNVEFILTGGKGENRTDLFTPACKPVLDFTKNKVLIYSVSEATYDAEAGITLPTPSTKDYADSDGNNIYYFKIQMIGEIEGTAVTLDNTLNVDFAFDKVITGTDGYVEFVKNGETTKMPLADCVVEGSDYYVMTFPGVSAKEMNETITVTVYAADGTAVSDVYSDSIEAYALRMLRNRPAGYTDAQYAALKTLLVDMLNYGAAAQGHFGYNKDDLINAELNDEEKALGTSTLKEAAPNTPASATAEQGYLGTAFELKSSLGMAIALDANILGDVTNAKVTFTDYQGKAQEFTVSAKDISSTDEYLVFVFGDLVAGNGRQDITWTFYDANGTEKLTVTDSLAAYVGRNMEKYAFLADILIYCDSAAAYFNA